jgi:hypothetical protein
VDRFGHRVKLVGVNWSGAETQAFTVGGLAAAPHVAAVLTNLADDLGLVDRMQDALAGEMNRRQELLRAAGNLASVEDYQRARERGADLEPLPALFVVVDEFSELLHQKPDLADLFTAIGRLGRWLQIHLLLASQRLDEGRLRGLDSHLSYRIGLRTFSAADSRAVLGVPDAASLPSVPGVGYLRSDTSSSRPTCGPSPTATASLAAPNLHWRNAFDNAGASPSAFVETVDGRCGSGLAGAGAVAARRGERVADQPVRLSHVVSVLPHALRRISR